MRNYYVYLHMDGKDVVYVGKGRNARAWVITGRCNKEHLDWMRAKLPRLVVKIVKSDLFESAALVLERKLVERYKPCFNQHFLRTSEKTLKHIEQFKKRVSTPEGLFDSVKVAAATCGISESGAAKRARNKLKGWSYAD